MSDVSIIGSDMACLEIALALAAAGHRVVLTHSVLASGACTCGRGNCPENTRGKHPIAKAWQRSATDDEQAIRDQFAALKFTPNVGVVLGPQPDEKYVVALDVDSADRLAELEAQHGPLPATRTGRSPRGERRFYSVVGDVSELKNITALGGKDKPGVDVKCSGGQVVVAGVNARGVYVAPDLSVPIAELPATWTQAILPAPKPPAKYSNYDPTDKRARNNAEKWLRSAILGEAMQVSRATEGTRNTVLHTSACRLFPCVIGVNGSMLEARSELAAAARATGIPDVEIQKTLDSAEKFTEANGNRRTPPERPKLRIVRDDEAVPEPESDLVMEDGKPAKIAENVARMLLKYPGGGPKLDEFADRVTWPSGKAIKDTDAGIVQGWLYDQTPCVRASLDVTWAGMLLAAERAKFHPVRHWLAKLQWDGVKRLDRLFPDYFGTMDDEYNRKVGAQFLIGMVARVMRPGCQLDTMPVFEGDQGSLKSSALRVLGGEWFVDSPLDPGHKDAMENLQGTWLQELGELEKLTRGDMAKLKAFVTQREDRYRPSYGRATVTRPRQSCFAATTNAKQYFTDETGGRRFRPVQCGTIALQKLTDDREQLWAEAYVRMMAGEPWWLSKELEAHAAEIVDERYQHDSWEERLNSLLAARSEVTTLEALSLLGIEVGRQTRGDAMRLGVAIGRIGFRKTRRRAPGQRTYSYVRVGTMGQVGTEES